MDGGSSPPISTKQIAGNDAGYLYFVEKISPPAPPQGGSAVPTWAPVAYGDLLKAGFVLLAIARPAAPALAVFVSKDTSSAGRLMTSFSRQICRLFVFRGENFTPCTPSRGICGAHVGTGRLRRLVKSRICFYWLSPDQPLPPLPSL